VETQILNSIMDWDGVRIISRAIFQCFIYLTNAGLLIGFANSILEGGGSLMRKPLKNLDEQKTIKAKFESKAQFFKYFGLFINLGVMIVCTIGGVTMKVESPTDTGARIITIFVNMQFMLLHGMNLSTLSLLGVSKSKIRVAQALNMAMYLGQYQIAFHMLPAYHNYSTFSIYSLTINNKWSELLLGFGIDILLCFWFLKTTTTKALTVDGLSKRYINGVKLRRLWAVQLLLMDLLISLLPPNRYM